MPDPVRVRDNETGAEYTTYAVDENGNSYEGLTVLRDKPAVDANGVLLPPTYPELEAEQDAEPTAEVDVPPASETSTVVPSTAKPTTAVTARPTEPTTGPKATSKES